MADKPTDKPAFEVEEDTVTGPIRDIFAGSEEAQAKKQKQLLKGLDADTLQEYIRHLNEVNVKLDALNEKKANLIIKERDTIGILLNQEKILNTIKQVETQRDRAKGGEKTKLTERIAGLKALHQETKRSQVEMQKVYDQTSDEYQKSKKHIRALMTDSKRTGSDLRNMAKKFAGSYKTDEALITSTQDVVNIAKSGAQGLATAIGDVSMEAAAMAMFMPGLAPQALFTEMAELPASLDSSFRQMTKSGVKYTESMDKAFVGLIDPLNAVIESTIGIEDADQMFVNIGLKAEDAQKSMSALRNGTMFMREEFIKADKPTAIYVGNLVAGLAKIGVAEQTSAKALDQFTKVLGQSPRKAASSLKQVVGVARSLDMNVGEAVKNFTSMMPKLAEWGDRAVDVFGNLQAQARATGISVDALNSVAMKLDTFRGAAEAAQGFNAVMGDTLLSVTDLVHAEPDEKIDMLRDAMDRSGTSFENANRRVKSMVASMLGVDVGTAARLFGSEEDFETAKERLSTEAATKKELDSAIDASMTAAEKAKRTVSSLVGGADKLVKRSHKVAAQFSSAAAKGIERTTRAIAKQEGGIINAEKAYISFMGTMAAVSEATPRRSIRTVLGVATGFGVLGELEKDSIYAAEEKLKAVGIEFDVNQDGVIGKPKGAAGGAPSPGTPGKQTKAAPKPVGGPGRAPVPIERAVAMSRREREAVEGTGLVQKKPEELRRADAAVAGTAPPAGEGEPGKETSPPERENLIVALVQNISTLAKSIEATRNVPVESTIKLYASEAEGADLARWVDERSVDAINRTITTT